jgi:hypothetical protein
VGSPGLRAATVGGRVLGAAFRAVALRSSARPLHPLGSVTGGRLRRHGAPPGGRRSGAAWLDEPGEDAVLVRLSRSAGLPRPLPDVFGLAVRVPVEAGPVDGAGYGDLLFSGTGSGRWTRFVLLPGRSASGHALGTLLPYRTPVGPVLLLARPLGETSFELSWARGRDPWTRFATLELTGDVAEDAPISFDAVRNPLPGLEVYPWVRRLREPSYASARRSRGLPG